MAVIWVSQTFTTLLEQCRNNLINISGQNVTGQLTDMPTCGLDKSRTGQLAVLQMRLAVVLFVLIA